jgi:hypothetical protein
MLTNSRDLIIGHKADGSVQTKNLSASAAIHSPMRRDQRLWILHQDGETLPDLSQSLHNQSTCRYQWWIQLIPL